MNVNIWVRDRYPFRYEEWSAIQETLRRIYGGRPVYLREGDFDWVSVDGVNITTARKIADAVKAFHLQAALKDKIFGYYRANEAPALQVEVELREQADGRPDWARDDKGMHHESE